MNELAFQEVYDLTDIERNQSVSVNVNGERVIFSCKIVKALLQEDKLAKYGIRLLKVLN